ncbi:hypothetical protein KBD75_02140 [Candidatus Woesebacteria bacterium]|nr:hypothetical protein [Candidatus Woesebacteria bacterium]
MTNTANRIESARVNNCVVGHVVGLHRSQDQRVGDAVFHDSQTGVGSIDKNCQYFKPEMDMDEVIGALVFYANYPFLNIGPISTEAVCGAMCKYRKTKTTRHEEQIYQSVSKSPIPQFPLGIR